MALVLSEDALAEFTHQIRQPLSALAALTSYLDLIVPIEDTRIREQLRSMHKEIDDLDLILSEGLRKLVGQSVTPRVDHTETELPDSGTEELSRPLINAAIASVTY